MFQQFDPSNQQIDFKDKINQQIALQFQLKLLTIYGPTLGIYVLPNLQNKLIWDGIIFIRDGFYKDARFKFQIYLRDFPIRQPSIYFKSTVFHPYINEKNGQLDVTSTLTDIWNYYNDNMIYDLMRDLKNIFIDKKALSNRFSYNRPAAQLYDHNSHEFITKIMKSVSLSSEQILLNDHSSCFYICQTPCQQIGKIQNILLASVSQKISLDEKIQSFINKILQ